MLVVHEDCGPDAGVYLPQLRQVERPVERTLELGAKRDRLECGHVVTHPGLWGVFHGTVQQGCDGLPGGYWSRKVPAQMIYTMEPVQ